MVRVAYLVIGGLLLIALVLGATPLLNPETATADPPPCPNYNCS